MLEKNKLEKLSNKLELSKELGFQKDIDLIIV